MGTTPVDGISASVNDGTLEESDVERKDEGGDPAEQGEEKDISMPVTPDTLRD